MDNEKKLLSRGEFLTAISGIGFAVFLAKFSSIKKISSALKTPDRRVGTIPGSYGNHTYGGTSSA